MRVLIAGAGGMLGRDLVSAFATHIVTAATRGELDITSPSACLDATAGHDVVINAAAWTRVDDAESHEAEASEVNATGAARLAAAAAEHGARFVQISTDYVFRGDAAHPYAEHAPLDPQTAYGRGKALGEDLVRRAHPAPHIVRTAWLYGEHGPNFPRTMLRLAAQHETVSVVADQLGQPTWTHDVADAILRLVDADAPADIYHATNSGQTTWFDLALAVFELHGLDPQRVLPTNSAAFVRPAPRPAYSVLGHGAWATVGIPEPRPWREALEEAAAAGIFTA